MTPRASFSGLVDAPAGAQGLADQIFARIKSMILSGRLASGARIPEEAIADEFGVSRTPIREALRQLREYGLVYKKPRSFSFVAEVPDDDAEDVAQVRRELECLAARQLAARATDDDVAKLKAIAGACARAARGGDRATAFECDSEFHNEIARRSGNRVLAETLERLDARIQLTRLKRCADNPTVTKDTRAHAAIIGAIAKHDADVAGDLMRTHLDRSGSSKAAGRKQAKR